MRKRSQIKKRTTVGLSVGVLVVLLDLVTTREGLVVLLEVDVFVPTFTASFGDPFVLVVILIEKGIRTVRVTVDSRSFLGQKSSLPALRRKMPV